MFKEFTLGDFNWQPFFSEPKTKFNSAHLDLNEEEKEETEPQLKTEQQPKKKISHGIRENQKIKKQ